MTLSNKFQVKATEAQINDKLSKNLKENITKQYEKWTTSKESAPSIPYLEVQLETFRALKKEAISLSTKIDWTANTLGISQSDLESVLVEISQTLQEARKLEKQAENKNQKISDQISSQGPALTLPKITNPCDILVWMKSYKQMSQYIHSDLTKLAIIKNSLTGKDKKSVEHLTTVGGVISYIHAKYLKGDLILNLLLKQAYNLAEPWTMTNSLKNIEEFLLIITNF